MDFESRDAADRQVLLKEGWATPEQIEEAGAIQKELKSLGLQPEPVVRILVQKGILTESRAREVEVRRAPDGELGLPEIPGYEILGTIGKGAVGTVYKGFQKSMARDVAIKVLFPETARTPGYVDRFFHEARMAARVKHPHIIAAY
ncbi:MAG: protein kinase, partial [Planctomycetes bacterium]|nr:protein kinase [Planctomycetota bacterium]